MSIGYYRRLGWLFKRDIRKFFPAVRLRTGLDHKLQKYYKRKNGYSGMPLTVGVRLSYRCNLRCIQCGQWGSQGIFKDVNPDELAREELSLEEIKNFIDEISDFKPYIYFTGGEPLMREDVFEIIEYASSKHMLTGMSTNATLLKDKAEELIESGLDYLYTSLDAVDELDTQIRRGNNSFHKALEGIQEVTHLRDVVGVGLPIIQVQTIIVNENQGELFSIGRYIEENIMPDVWGVQLCVFTTTREYERGRKLFLDKYGIEPIHWKGFIQDSTKNAELDVLNRQLEEIKSYDWDFRLRLYSPLEVKDFDVGTYFQDTEKTFIDYPCMYPWAFAQIQPDGGVAFCGSQPDYVIGNIRDECFKNIWNNYKARQFRRDIQKNPLPFCSRCFGLHIFSKYK